MCADVGNPVKHVRLYTDGACAGNPGPGGWAAILVCDDKRKEISGGEAHTTNNRMEILAAVMGLSEIKTSCKVTVYTDSNYLKLGITEWITSWKKKNWRKSSKEPVKNVDLWQQLDKVASKHNVSWQWIKGHNGHPENERADKLARLARPMPN
jgi:ribonuclease HI